MTLKLAKPLGQKLLFKKDSVAATDVNIRDVSLLLHGNGTNGSTMIVDSSLNPNTVTAAGNAQISTAQSKFGSSSIKLDGTGDYLTVPNTRGPADFGSLDYTIEMWVQVNSASNFGSLIGKGPPNTANSNTFFTLEFQGASNSLSFNVGALQAYIITGTASIRNSSSWNHIAVCRSGASTRLFVNGAQDGATYVGNYTIAPGQTTYIGCSPFLNVINGYIDELRITKGVARYTSNFTPPTAPFPDF